MDLDKLTDSPRKCPICNEWFDLYHETRSIGKYGCCIECLNKKKEKKS